MFVHQLPRQLPPHWRDVSVCPVLSAAHIQLPSNRPLMYNGKFYINLSNIQIAKQSIALLRQKRAKHAFFYIFTDFR